MRRITRSMLLRATGNFLLGVSVGLLGYYGLTTVVNETEQAQLEAEVPRAYAAVASLPQTLPADPVDLSNWADEDEAYWRSLPGGAAFGRLVVPAMGLDAAIVKGAQPSQLRKGPGWVEWTDLPGGTGNTGIAGHRTTYGAPFRRIDEMGPGDLIDVYSPYRRYRYQVDGVEVVTPDAVRVMRTTEEPRITLSACHPLYSARYRYIVTGRLVEARRLEE